MKFKVGDFVIPNKSIYGLDWVVGQKATIVKIDSNSFLLKFHNYNSSSTLNKYWWISFEEIKEWTHISQYMDHPPPPYELIIAKKIKYLCNKSSFVKKHPHLEY